MEGGSKHALEAVLDRVGDALGDDVDARTLGTDLFSLATVLDAQHTLRRALTEPAVAAEAKTRLLHTLFDGRLSESSLSVAEVGVGSRWSTTRDFCDALEEASVTALVARADREDGLDTLEDNLFRFSRITEGSAGLRDAFADEAVPVEGKQQLVRDLVGDQVDDTTTVLLGQAVAGRHRSLTNTLAYYQRLAAARRDSMIATVWVASPLTEDQHGRLAAALAAQHDKAIHLNVIVDPEVLGGVRVSVGDEVLDSTVESRLTQARRRLER